MIDEFKNVDKNIDKMLTYMIVLTQLNKDILLELRNINKSIKEGKTSQV